MIKTAILIFLVLFGSISPNGDINQPPQATDDADKFFSDKKLGGDNMRYSDMGRFNNNPRFRAVSATKPLSEISWIFVMDLNDCDERKGVCRVVFIQEFKGGYLEKIFIDERILSLKSGELGKLVVYDGDTEEALRLLEKWTRP